MPTNTSGGTTTSFMNTPQAVDDFTCAVEDDVFFFDVMSNDLGGSAKILWSIDDSNLTDDSTSGTYDLLTRDGTATSIPERSDLGALISIVNGVVKYDSNPIDSLAAGQTVCDKFTYAIRLSNGTLSWATVYVTLTGTNDGVSIVAGGTTASGAVVEDSAQTASPTDSNVATGTIAFDDPDLTDVHTATFVADSSNTTTLGTFSLGSLNEASNTTGGTVGWTYTIDEAAAQSLAAGQVKTEKFVVTITDPGGLTATQIVSVTVTGTNDGPVANPDTDSGHENETLLIDVLVNDADVDDGAVLAVTTASTPAGEGTASVVGNQVQFDPGTDFDHLALGDSALVVVSYTISDEHGATSASTATITVTGTNDGPVANADAGTTSENASVLIDVLANDDDVDDGAVLTVTAATAPAGQGSTSVVSNQVEFDPGADFDYLAVGESALVVVSYSIEDEHGASASSSIEVTVTGTNDGVSIVAGDTIASGAVVEDSAQTASPADSHVASGTVAFDDPDLSDVHTADFDPDPTNTTNLGTFALGPVAEAANASGGTVGWTYTIDEAAAQSLAKDEVKTEKFVVTVTDPHGLTATQIVTVTITGTNDGPVANADTDTTAENVAILVDVLANDTDVDNGAVLTVTAASAPVGEGTASVVGNQVRFDPGADFDHLNVGDTAEVEVSYTIEDEHGATSSSTVTITVTGTNDGPVANADTDATAENDVLLVDVLANDTDTDDDHVLTVTTASAPAGQGTASVVGNKVQFDPGADFDYLAVGETAQVVVDYSISDEHGATSDSTVTITVTGTNDGPTAVADTATTAEDSSMSIDVLGNDTDPDTTDTLTVTAANVTGGLGTASVVAGEVVYNPGTAYNYLAVDEEAEVTIEYSISDGNGGTSTSTVTVTVTGANDGPTANADTATTAEDTSVLIDVLGNDSDPDTSDTLSITAANVTTGLGSATIESGQVRYDPGTAYNSLAVGETANVVVTYSISDGHGGTATSTAAVTVTGTNDNPDIRVQAGDSDSITIAETNAGLLASDTFTVTDADTSDTISTGIALTTVSGNQGSLTNAQLLAMLSVVPTSGLPANAGSANNLTWTFNSGTEAFNYLLVGQSLNLTYTLTVSDGHGGSDTQTLTVAVTGTADGITLTPVYTGDDDPNNFDGANAQAVDTTLITGTIGDNLINGSPQGDTIRALDGNDTVNADNGGDTVYGGTGVDTINGGQGNDLLYGQAGNDIIHGDGNNDQIWGGSGDDQIFGDNNDDMTLWGGSGTDTISGGNNNDRIAGGFGADSLNGNGGNDDFVYLDVRDRGDTITGFEVGSDNIDLSAIDANSAVAGEQSFIFGGTTATANGIWYEQVSGNTRVYVDSDGDVTTAELWMTLTGTLTLTGGDFIP